MRVGQLFAKGKHKKDKKKTNKKSRKKERVEKSYGKKDRKGELALFIVNRFSRSQIFSFVDHCLAVLFYNMDDCIG